MARIRTVKPELYLDEDLGVLSGDHTVLFTALWTMADREGRLEDRPTRIKASAFPYRPVDVEALLADLEHIEKIDRYEVDGVRIIAICSFLKHQRPHPKEPASQLPEHPSRVKKRPAAACREMPGSIPSSPVGREGKGRESKGREQEPPHTAFDGDSEETIPDFQLKKLAREQDLPVAPELEWIGWAEDERHKAHPRALPDTPASHKYFAWVEQVKRAGLNLGQTRAAYVAFLRDEKWATKLNPPCPWDAWASKWKGYMPGQAAGAPVRKMLGPRPQTPEEIRAEDAAKKAGGAA